MIKGSKHTEETKRLMSLKQKGKNHPFFGKRHSEETKVKIKLARAKQINTLESNRKRSETQKGRTFSKESIEKMRQHALKRFSKKKNHPHYGKTFSKKHRENISKSLKGRTLDELHSPKKCEEIRKKIRKSRAKQIFPLKDSSIEIKIRGFLERLKIEYYQHKYMNIKHAYQCDFFIPSMNLVIECDGVYWHKYPTRRDIDNIRTDELLKKGFRVLRLWEFEIKPMTIKEFKGMIKNETN